MSARRRAPGAGGAVVRATPGAPESATSARPPSAPARSSSARAAARSATTAARSAPAERRRRAPARSRPRPRARRPASGALPGAAACAAQELVGRRELGADARRPRGGRPRRRSRRPGARSAPPRSPRRPRPARRGAPAPRRRARRPGAAAASRCAASAASSRSSASARSASSSSSSASSASMRSRRPRPACPAPACARRPSSWRPRRSMRSASASRRLARALQAQLDALGRRARAVQAPGERLALLGALGQRLLGLLAAARDLGQRGLRLLARGARGGGGALGRAELLAPGAHGVARELPARLEGLALEALVQLGRLGLALERAQARARLALDVERAVEVVLRALELELRAAPALAVLAEPGGLLDQQPPVARLGGDDRLDAALRDDRVHLLAQAGVGEHLEHVDQPAARAVEAVLALAGAVQPAHDRDLAQRQVDGAVGVVEHDLDLGRRARLHAVAAAEDHVLHRLAAHGQRRLLAHRPQHGVGDVGLARAVGADDDRHPGGELEPRAVRERLEALEGQRLQVHQSSNSSSSAESSISSAVRAASCSASFFERPSPRPTGRSPTAATPRRSARAAGPLGRHLVADDLAAPGQALLQRRLEVHRMLERVLDLRRERLDHRRRRRLVADVQVAGADHRLDDGGQHALGRHQRRGALARRRPAPRRPGAPAPRAARPPRGTTGPRPPARGSSSAARRRSARPPGADRGAW